MAINFRFVAVLSCAMAFSLTGAGFVCAQTQEDPIPPMPAGVGADTPMAEGDGQDAEGDAQGDAEQPSAAGEDPIPPMPAGVPAAEAPRAEGERREAEGDEEDLDPALSAGAAPATSGMLSTQSFRGLFRGAAPGRGVGHTLDLSASAYGVHAEGDTQGFVGTDDLLGDGSTRYGGSSLSLIYGRHWTEASIGAFGSGSLAYIPEHEDRGADPWVNRWSVGGDAAFSRALTRRVRARGHANVDYSPYFQQDLLSQALTPTVAPPLIGTPGLDFTLARDPSVRSVVEGSLSYLRSRRASLEGYYSLNRRDFVSSDTSSYYDQLVGGRYVYRLNRWVGLRAGYGLRTAKYSGSDDDPIYSHEIDVGADGGYGRSFALARRTTFSFNTGSSLFVRERVDENSNDDQNAGGARLFVNGSADLVHAWALTWSANLGARRTVNYELGFREPLLSNGVYAGFGGLLAPRLDLTGTAAYTSGSVGFGSGENGFATSSATAALRLALTEWLAAYAQYFYYQYDFESGVTLPGFLQRGHDRRGVSVGLTTSFPLIGSRGRP